MRSTWLCWTSLCCSCLGWSAHPQLSLNRFEPSHVAALYLELPGKKTPWHTLSPWCRWLRFIRRNLLTFTRCSANMSLSMITWVRMNKIITPEHETCIELPACVLIAFLEGHWFGDCPQNSLAHLNANELHGYPWVCNVVTGKPCTVSCSRCVIHLLWTWLIRKLVDAVSVINDCQGWCSWCIKLTVFVQIFKVNQNGKSEKEPYK